MANLCPDSLVTMARLVGLELARVEDGLRTLKGIPEEGQAEDLKEAIKDGEAYEKKLLQAIEDLKGFIQPADSKIIPAIIEAARSDVKEAIDHAIEQQNKN